MIEKAYRLGRVNEDFIGNWDDAQVYLGLKDQSEVPKRNRNMFTSPWKYKRPEPIGFTVGRSNALKTQAKTKRKQQSQSRKKNRTKRK
jgi:hypothetical protein